VLLKTLTFQMCTEHQNPGKASPSETGNVRASEPNISKA